MVKVSESTNRTLKSAFDLNREVENRWNGRVRSKVDEHADTDVEEFITEAKNEWMLADKHQLQGGIGITQNNIRLVEDTFDIVFVDIQEKVNRVHFFAQDQLSLGALFEQMIEETLNGVRYKTHACQLISCTS